MATRRKTSMKSKSGMMSGIIIGLILGLAVAVAAALYITKAPIPFMNKTSQEVEDLLSSDMPQSSDPNLGLYGKSLSSESPIFSGQEAQIAKDFGKLITPSPNLEISRDKNQAADSLDSLIAQLPSPQTSTDASASLSATKPTPSKPTQVAKAQGSYYLQAGAFRAAKDAESVRARILLLGLNVNVQPGSYDGGSINRVRVGPFQGIDEMNRARALLGQEKIETSVVRP